MVTDGDSILSETPDEDAALAQTCAELKTTTTSVNVVALETTSPRVVSLLQNCATDGYNFYQVGSSMLEHALRAIAYHQTSIRER